MSALRARVYAWSLPRTTFRSSGKSTCIYNSHLYKSNPFRCHSTKTAAPFPPTSSSSSSPSSVSHEEVSHFTKLASSWWDPHGPSRLLHLMNPLRHDFIQSCLNSNPHSTDDTKYTYLDIGCGGGIFATSAARLPSTRSVTAIDPTPSVIRVAKSKQNTDPALREPKLRYLNCAIEELESQAGENGSTTGDEIQTEHRARDEDQIHQKSTSPTQPQYDIITLFEVIEHISRPSEFLTTALKHLKPGGWLIGSTIARHPISYITTKLIAEAPLIGVVPKGTHDWNQYINPSELKGWFDQRNADALNVSRSSLHGEATNANGQKWGHVKIRGVVYVPLVGWKWIDGSEKVGNYFFGVQKLHSSTM